MSLHKKQKFSNGLRWTKEQINYVCENYGCLSLDDIALKIGKNSGTIRTKMSRMGVEHVQALRIWSEQSLFLALFTDAPKNNDFKFVFRTGRFIEIGNTKFEEIWIRDHKEIFQHLVDSQIKQYQIEGYQSFRSNEIESFTFKGSCYLETEEKNKFELFDVFHDTQWNNNINIYVNKHIKNDNGLEY